MKGGAMSAAWRGVAWRVWDGGGLCVEEKKKKLINIIIKA